jgi:hypothetical protein
MRGIERWSLEAAFPHEPPITGCRDAVSVAACRIQLTGPGELDHSGVVGRRIDLELPFAASPLVARDPPLDAKRLDASGADPELSPMRRDGSNSHHLTERFDIEARRACHRPSACDNFVIRASIAARDRPATGAQRTRSAGNRVCR